MKKYKNLVVILLICGLLNLLLNKVITCFLAKSADGIFLQKQPYFIYLIIMLQIFSKITWIPLGVWVFIDSKKELFSPWLWGLLVLIFPLQGLIVYFLIQLLQSKTTNSINT